VSSSTRIFFCAASSHPPAQFPSNLPRLEALAATGRGVFLLSELAEFWSFATRPAEVNGLGFSYEEALREVAEIENLLALLPDIPAIYPVWKQLVADHRVQGVKVHDARLVAVRMVYSIEGILTFNFADFKRYGNIRAHHPASLA
jgi:predicted nucleic acid-binding protein